MQNISSRPDRLGQVGLEELDFHFPRLFLCLCRRILERTAYLEHTRHFICWQTIGIYMNCPFTKLVQTQNWNSRRKAAHTASALAHDSGKETTGYFKRGGKAPRECIAGREPIHPSVYPSVDRIPQTILPNSLPSSLHHLPPPHPEPTTTPHSPSAYPANTPHPPYPSAPPRPQVPPSRSSPAPGPGAAPSTPAAQLAP